MTEARQNIELPGHTLRPRRGVAPFASDRPFIAGLFLSSPARAYLENMRPSRARGGLLSRTLARRAIEERLDTLIRRSGEETQHELDACNAFLDSTAAEEEGRRLRMPGPVVD